MISCGQLGSRRFQIVDVALLHLLESPKQSACGRRILPPRFHREDGSALLGHEFEA